MVESELRPGGQFEYMKDWAGKFPGQAARLAGLFHVVTEPDPRTTLVSADTMRSALSVAAILAEHAKAAYGLMGSDPSQDCARAILGWIMRDHVERFTARDALEKIKGRFPTMDRVNAGLSVLEDRAFIFEESGETKKRPGRKQSTAYIVNPKIWEA
jgi:putative DNA primase/helicase